MRCIQKKNNVPEQIMLIVKQKVTENIIGIVKKIGNLVMYLVAKWNINFLTWIPSRGTASNTKSTSVSFINEEDFVAMARLKLFTPVVIV